MHNSFMVRRIDDLGRIVIPKELRRRLRIKNGDNLEIAVDDDSIIISKHDFMSKFKDIYIGIIDSFYKVINKDILLTNNDIYLYGTGEAGKKVSFKKVAREITNIMEKRCDDLVKGSFSLTDGYVFNGSLFISPFIVHGDIMGAIILASDNVTDSDIMIMNGISAFICAYIE